jgi:hypothetical protein
MSRMLLAGRPSSEKRTLRLTCQSLRASRVKRNKEDTENDEQDGKHFQVETYIVENTAALEFAFMFAPTC